MKVLLIGSAVIGLFSCVVFAIGGLMVYLKKKFRKGIIGLLIENLVLHQQTIKNRKIKNKK